MAHDRDEMVEVSGELRQDRENAWAIFCGDYMKNKHEGGQPMEVYVFLPKSLCRQGDNKNTWMVPEWMAQEKGLI